MNIKSVISKTVIIICVCIIFFPKTVTIAGWSDIFSSGSDFINKGQSEIENNPISTSEVKKTSRNIFNLLVGIGTVIAIAVGGILGIKFMMASVEDKAKVKEAVIAYVLGCVLIFGAFAIWKIVVNTVQQITV